MPDCVCTPTRKCMRHFDLDGFILRTALEPNPKDSIPALPENEPGGEAYETWVGEQYLKDERNDL